MAPGSPPPTQAQIATLVALADGSLPNRRRAAARGMLEYSPELAAQLDEQRRAVRSLRALDVRAPARLRARIDGLTARVR
jgi:hypothetical protein